MSEWFGWFVFALLVIGAAALIVGKRAGIADLRGLPDELVGAQLAYAERTFRSFQRLILARLDRAYRTADGLMLVELKTRREDRVFATDVIELSAQRVAVQDDTGESVSSIGWVVVDRSGRRRAHRVILLSTEEVAGLRARHDDLVHGQLSRPKPARSLRQCTNCGHRRRCAEKYRDRG